MIYKSFLVFLLSSTLSFASAEKGETLKCSGVNSQIQISGIYYLSKENKLLPGRSRNDNLLRGLMREYEYHSASADLQVKLSLDGETIEFHSQPKGEGYPASANTLASATLREEGVIIHPDQEGSIDQFYLYFDGPSEINITYKSDLDGKSKFGKRTVRFELNCEAVN